MSRTKSEALRVPFRLRLAGCLQALAERPRPFADRRLPRALTASGHAAAAPLSAASNSRRPMVTAMRPSRARCVRGTVSRHGRPVLTRRAGCWLLPPLVVGFNQLLCPRQPVWGLDCAVVD